MAPNGTDSASAGTTSSPFRTIAYALQQADAGDTIVLRGGEYHESLTISKAVTIQAYPGEAVWLDGSRIVSGWVADGSAWRYDGWTIEFDTSPTYTRGAADNQEQFWGFVNANYPMAAHPDQIWVDGTALRQVGSRAEVTTGTFFHDRPGNRLYIGTNPSGRTVRVADLVQAIKIRAENVTLRGFGARRYAPSVPDMGAITLERPRITLEHFAVVDTSTTGISVVAANGTLRNVYVAGNGMLGIHGNYADNVLLDRVLSENNNVERFNNSPVSGGTKVTRARNPVVRDSVFRNNFGTGLWFDESSYNITITGSEMRDNGGHGISLEISATALVANNIVEGNSVEGIKLNNISTVRLWNNTFVGNNRNIWIAQDSRRYNDGSPGKDPRTPNDPAMSWVVGPVEIVNNIVANPRAGAPCLLCATGTVHADSMRIAANGNVYNRSTASSPSVLVMWSTGPSTDARYNTLDAFTQATGQDASSVLVNGAAVVDSNGSPTASLPAASSVARPIPSDVAGQIGTSANARHLGAIGG